MKKILLCLVILATGLTACGKNETIEKPKEKVQTEVKNPSLSNMASDKSFEFVKRTLEENLATDNDMAKANVNKFMNMVSDYNKSVGEENLIGDFKEDINPTYEVGKLIENREKSDKNYPDTNCRINAYLLALANMKVQKAGNPDDEMLFMDLEKIKEGKIFDSQVRETFRKFFLRVATNSSKNPEEQAKVMEKYFEDWSFPKNASLVSVVIHDNLDGNYLFIGHIGVLVKTDEGYLFVEKISFEEPYQAIKFPNRQACYGYLKEKFKDYTDTEVCPPFVMDNGEYVG